MQVLKVKAVLKINRQIDNTKLRSINRKIDF